MTLLVVVWAPISNAATRSGGSGFGGSECIIFMLQDLPGLANPVNPQVESLPPAREIQYNRFTSIQEDDDADGL